jgi:hypothetical protein
VTSWVTLSLWRSAVLHGVNELFHMNFDLLRTILLQCCFEYSHNLEGINGLTDTFLNIWCAFCYLYIARAYIAIHRSSVRRVFLLWRDMRLKRQTWLWFTWQNYFWGMWNLRMYSGAQCTWTEHVDRLFSHQFNPEPRIKWVLQCTSK